MTKLKLNSILILAALGGGTAPSTQVRAEDFPEIKISILEERIARLEEKLNPTKNSFKTSAGVTLKHILDPKFGYSVLTPDGLLWSSFQGTYSNEGTYNANTFVVEKSPATAVCASIGGRLPTSAEALKLAGYFKFNSRGRIADFDEVKKAFPEFAKANDLWTSTGVDPTYTSGFKVYVFEPHLDHVRPDYMPASWTRGVVCVK